MIDYPRHDEDDEALPMSEAKARDLVAAAKANRTAELQAAIDEERTYDEELVRQAAAQSEAAAERVKAKRGSFVLAKEYGDGPWRPTLSGTKLEPEVQCVICGILMKKERRKVKEGEGRAA